MTNADGRAGREAAELVESGAAREIYALAGDWVAITAPPRFSWIARHSRTCSRRSPTSGCWGTGSSRGCAASSSPIARSARARRCSTSRRATGRTASSRSAGWTARCSLPWSEQRRRRGTVTAAGRGGDGAAAGTPVVAGGADTQLALLGIGVTQPGRFTVVGGSFWQHTVVLDEPLIDPAARLRTLCHALEGRWMMEGIGFFCGIVMRWFRDAFCGLEKARGRARGVDVYTCWRSGRRRAARRQRRLRDLLEPHAGQPLGARLAGLRGLRRRRPEASGRDECFRAIEESAAYVSRGHWAIVEEVAGIAVDRLILTGGAAKGRLWPQIIADALDVPVEIPVVKESTALGAAICAGVGAGLFSDAGETGARLLAIERTYEPDPAAAGRTPLYEQWLELYRRSLELSEAGLVRPLWRAAGA